MLASLIIGVGGKQTGYSSTEGWNLSFLSHTARKSVANWSKISIFEHTLKCLEERAEIPFQPTAQEELCEQNSGCPGNKTKNKQVGLYEIQKLCTAKQKVNQLKNL